MKALHVFILLKHLSKQLRLWKSFWCDLNGAGEAQEVVQKLTTLLFVWKCCAGEFYCLFVCLSLIPVQEYGCCIFDDEETSCHQDSSASSFLLGLMLTRSWRDWSDQSDSEVSIWLANAIVICQLFQTPPSRQRPVICRRVYPYHLLTFLSVIKQT